MGSYPIALFVRDRQMPYRRSPAVRTYRFDLMAFCIDTVRATVKQHEWVRPWLLLLLTIILYCGPTNRYCRNECTAAHVRTILLRRTCALFDPSERTRRRTGTPPPPSSSFWTPWKRLVHCSAGLEARSPTGRKNRIRCLAIRRQIYDGQKKKI